MLNRHELFPILLLAAVFSAAAESPYGTEVVECVTGEKNPFYNNPTNALGPPVQFVPLYSGSMGGVSSDAYGGVVNPVVPAFGTNKMHLSLVTPDEEEPGYVIIAFDHDVVDDPDNPFGMDFIVFGNAGCMKSTSTGTTALDDPATCRLTTSGFGNDLGVVEVAQYRDGPWYSSESWRMVDDFAPTLGHVYDPANADTNLYSGNLWWGAPTDPTYPVDPRIDFSDCAGLTLAQLCQRYNGSAGGAGYDLAEAIDEEGNELPSDIAHGGRKWFRYVKISSAEIDEEGDTGFTGPEVDAVADVRPATGYELWRERHYTDWATAWQATPEALAANGLPNGLNCVYGLKPTDAAANVPFEVVAFEQGETEHVIQMRSPTRLTATPKGLVVKKAAALDGEWTAVAPTFVSTRQDGNVWLNTFSVPNDAAARFFKLALDAE